MAISEFDYAFNLVYLKIANRLQKLYHIPLSYHIESMSHIAKNEQEGITFVPLDQSMLIAALKATKAFHNDNRGDIWGALAAAATTGEGYREIGETSLHCQISKSICNIHIDYYGFIWLGPNGESIAGPNAVQHIADELGWAKIVQLVRGKSEIAAKILERWHPVVPSVENKFIPKIGFTYDLLSGDGWSLVFDYSYGCGDYTCKGRETFKGLTFTYRH